ncbi:MULTISPECIES: hypothetical protein [Streptomyces]|uniref:hypothetical protein n=1 Tax=Streptomyces lycopersici TaxID=2974589 RepID=UPI0021D3DBB4|nr:hypothetical protein [Streptomyces sp. NEAU-383]
MPTHLIKILFRLGVLGFLLGGLCIVAGQTLGLALGDAAWVNGVATTAGPPTFITAGITGLLAYVLSYARPGDPEPATTTSTATATATATGTSTPEPRPAETAPQPD